LAEQEGHQSSKALLLIIDIWASSSNNLECETGFAKELAPKLSQELLNNPKTIFFCAVTALVYG
jgi:hypothetical protein